MSNEPDDKDMDYQNIVYCLNGKCKERIGVDDK